MQAGQALPGDVLVLAGGDVRQLAAVTHCDSPDDLVRLDWGDGRLSLVERTRLMPRLSSPRTPAPTPPAPPTDGDPT